MSFPPGDGFVFALDGGMVDYLVDLGAELRAGDAIAQIWPTGHTGRAPATCVSPRDGVLAGRHHPGLIEAGDCLAVLAVYDQ